MRRQGGGVYGVDSAGRHVYGGPTRRPEQQQQQQPAHVEKDDSALHNQWRWERDGGAHAKLPQTAMSPTTPFVEGQGREPPRSYYRNQRIDPRMPLEKQDGGDPRSQPQEEDMDIGYEDIRPPQSFEGLEQRFVDDIMKLSKEQTDAEDAENARHRERVNAINAQYEERLAVLRAQHASRREEFLRRESQARQEQFQRVVVGQYPESGVSPVDPRGYNSGTVPAGEPRRAYNSDYYDSYRERGQFPGHARDHGHEPKVPYPRGRVYDTGSRYY